MAIKSPLSNAAARCSCTLAYPALVTMSMKAAGVGTPRSGSRPTGFLTVADQHSRGGSSEADCGSDALEVGGQAVAIFQVALQSAVLFELQQVDHHHGASAGRAASAAN